MSHFTLLVCLNDAGLPQLSRAARVGKDFGGALQSGVTHRLETALAPFDENMQAELYRDYEKGGPADYWAVDLFRKENGLNPDDTTLTWEQVAQVYNDRFSEDGDELHVDESGRAYTMSTYNPDSKWDWYSIGGRWAGQFVFRPQHKDLVIHGERSWTNENDVIMPGHCDGGQKRALDLPRMRDEAAKEAKKTYATYAEVTAGTPDALPWSAFTDNVSAGNGYTIDQAREEYHSQPRIIALQQNKDFGPFTNNEDFACGEKLYIERARARAVPGFALLTTDGHWMAPGDMGWFGMSTDSEGSRIGYWETANAYVEALPDDAWLISVDCHI